MLSNRIDVNYIRNKENMPPMGLLTYFLTEFYLSLRVKNNVNAVSVSEVTETERRYLYRRVPTPIILLSHFLRV